MPAQVGITTVPAAVGGVNFYDSLFGMPPEDAIQLINWWPQVYGCTHRKGFVEWSRDLPASVNSLYSFHTIGGGTFLYAFAGAAMYNVTNKGAAPVSVVSSLTTSIWAATMMSNSAGTHKVFVSGQDNPIWIHQPTPPAVAYDRLTAGDGTAPGTVAGVDPATFIDVTIHQRRLWFTQKGTTLGWYMPPDQIYGVAKKFDFGPLFKNGGFLQSIATWTVDDGDGSDDMLVAFGSQGDVVVYKGIDPSSADTWSLQGVYFAGPLIAGHRFHTKVAGDIKFLTQQGLVSMNDMMTSSRVVSPESNVESQKVQQFLSEQATLYGFLEGWEIKFITNLNMLVVSIPGLTMDGDVQVAENIVNSKWTMFRGMSLNCICPDYQTVFFFGTDAGRVYQGWTGHADNVNPDLPEGNAVTALVQQAYNYFGTPANNKQVGMYRPNFLLSNSLAWKSSISYDFSFKTPVVTDQPGQAPGATWDHAIWDKSFWSGGLKAQKQWAQASGYGYAASLSMATRSFGEVTWVNTDFTVSSGGIL